MATKTIKRTTVKAEVPSVVEDKVETRVVEPRKFDNADVISCRSITAGELILNGAKSGSKYVWSNDGDYCEVEYRDLVNLVRSGSAYVNAPLFIIEDEDFLNEFPKVREVYEALYSINDLKDILRLPVNQMKSTINSLPEGAKKSLQNLASTMISNGQLDSLNKIKAIDEIFDTKLEVLTGLFDE